MGVYVKTVQNARIRTAPSAKACEALSEIHKNASISTSLFPFCRVFGPEPFVSLSLEGVNALVILVHKLLCQPGTRRLVGSGTVEEKGPIHGVFGHPVNAIFL